MNITLLDSETLGDKLDFSLLETFGNVTVYSHTDPEQVAERIENADIIIINKVKINKENLVKAKNLKLICLFATGYDNVNLDHCREKGIGVCNVKGYSTDSVAQLTVAMALQLACRIPEYTHYVNTGAYTKSGMSNYLEPFYYELAGKTWGIIGLGNIGKKVAKVAEALGCTVVVNKRTPVSDYENLSVDDLCKCADIISLHTPLTPETKGLIGKKQLDLMKNTAILINVARGAVTDEVEVAQAVLNKKIGGFATDVYSTEPLCENHPFNKIMGMKNVCLTPHMGWGAYEARVRCLNEIIKNITSFINGEKRNRVDL